MLIQHPLYPLLERLNPIGDLNLVTTCQPVRSLSLLCLLDVLQIDIFNLEDLLE